jgi:hypothetical protein
MRNNCYNTIPPPVPPLFCFYSICFAFFALVCLFCLVDLHFGLFSVSLSSTLFQKQKFYSFTKQTETAWWLGFGSNQNKKKYATGQPVTDVVRPYPTFLGTGLFSEIKQIYSDVFLKGTYPKTSIQQKFSVEYLICVRLLYIRPF